MLTPDQFKPNETWIALKVNTKPVFVLKAPYDIYVLMDACSGFVFGHVSSSVATQTPNKKDVEAVFKQAWKIKKEWAKTLILTGNTETESVFKTCAEQNGLLIKNTPLSELEDVIDDVLQAFATL